MDRRADTVDAVHRTALGMPGRQVATVGRLEAEPGAPNVVPGRVRLTLEVRDLTMEGIERVFDAVRTEEGLTEDQVQSSHAVARRAVTTSWCGPSPRQRQIAWTAASRSPSCSRCFSTRYSTTSER